MNTAREGALIVCLNLRWMQRSTYQLFAQKLLEFRTLVSNTKTRTRYQNQKVNTPS
jgi:hypothetical protein